MAVVFALVVVVAALLGRFGTGIDAGPGPAVGIDQSASGDGPAERVRVAGRRVPGQDEGPGVEAPMSSQAELDRRDSS